MRGRSPKLGHGRSPRLAPIRTATAVPALAAVVAVVAAGCGAGGSSSTAASVPTPVVAVANAHHSLVKWSKHLTLRVTHGTLSTVAVRTASGSTIAGSMNAARTSWRSSTTLVPKTKMTADVAYDDLAHSRHSTAVTVTSTDSKTHFHAQLSPGDGATVGIGQPVVVTLDHPVPASKQAEVEHALTVTTSPSVTGAWHWMSDQVLHYRGPHYWRTGTTITVSSDLAGIDLGHGVWGTAKKHSTSFTIGAAHISEADLATDVMKVYSNGHLIKTLPFSGGRSEYPTADGVHVALEKSQTVIMDSATVGIPKGSPGYYYEKVYWDVRISDGGAFVHAAPWSVGDQGHTNVSHGCINLSTANAEWFYNWARTGDVVDVYGGVRPPVLSDPGMSDWNLSWKKWLKGDADPTAAAKALHPKHTPHETEPGL
jgi:lipoprotein-anchoring transpeptidase ErfK/SrfK